MTVKDPVIVGERKLELAEAVFADVSGSIALDIWEAMIDTIKEGNCYCLSNVLVRIWSGEKKLSTLSHFYIYSLISHQFPRSQMKRRLSTSVLI